MTNLSGYANMNYMQPNFMDMTAMYAYPSQVMNTFQNVMSYADMAMKYQADYWEKIHKDDSSSKTTTSTTTTSEETKTALAAIDQEEAAEIAKVKEITQQKVTAPVVEDGKDDGSIGFWGAAKNMLKGAGKAVTGMFCDENGFSLKRTLVTVGTAAACTALTVATGGAAAPFLVGAGIAMGGAQIAKGALKASAATTDAQAEQAWQDVGAGTLAVGASVLGAKGALKAANPTAAMPKGNILTSSLRAAKDCTVQTAKGSYNLVRHPKTTYGNLKAFYNSDVKVNVKNLLSSERTKANAQKSFERVEAKEISKINTQKDKLINELADLQNDPVANAAKITEINTKLTDLNTKLTAKGLQHGEVQSNLTTKQHDYSKWSKIREDIDALNKKLSEATDPAEMTKLANQIKTKQNEYVYELSTRTTQGTRNNQVTTYKNAVEKIKNDLAKAKENGLTKEEIKLLHEKLNIKEQQLVKAESYKNIELKEQAIATAKNRMQKVQDNVINKTQEKMKNLNDEYAGAADARKVEIRQELNKHQQILDKVNGYIEKQKGIISSNEHSLNTMNLKYARNDFNKNLPYSVPVTLTANELYVSTPEMTEQTVVSEEMAEAEAKALQEIKTYYDKQRALVSQETKTQTNTQTQNQMAQMYNPFLTNPMMSMNGAGMGMGMGFGSGMDSLSFYKSPFPQTI